MAYARHTFHEGELLVQRQTGDDGEAARLAGMVADRVAPPIRTFLAMQTTMAMATVDDDGTLVSSFFVGEPGLLTTPSERVVRVDRARLGASDGEDDRAWRNLRVGTAIGLLAFDLGTRRRVRLNGIVRAADATTIELEVAEAYPNCPKYIQRRRLVVAPAITPTPTQSITGVALDEPRRALIERADTMFVASRHPTRGLDASHRGGEPGFLRVVAPNTIRVPDYDGNGMYNTLGNFAVEPHAGLAIVDFTSGRVLQLTGRVTLAFDRDDDPRQPTGGTGRYWEFAVDAWREQALPARHTWELIDTSPFNPKPRAATHAHAPAPAPARKGSR